MQQRKELEELYQKKYNHFLKYVSRKFNVDKNSAEDLIQESFFTAFKKIDQYNPELGNLDNWLYGIVRNVALGKLRRYNSESRNLERLALESQTSYKSMEEEAILKDFSSKVKNNIEENGLDQKTKKALYLWLDGTSQRVIGRKLKLSRYKVMNII